MKTFQRPNYALYFENEDQILAELNLQDVLLIKSSMNEDELQNVWIYHPSQRDWMPIEQNQEIFNAPFEFQRNVKSPQPRLPGPPIKPGPPKAPSAIAPATAARPMPPPAPKAPPKAAPNAVAAQTIQRPAPPVSVKPSEPSVMKQKSSASAPPSPAPSAAKPKPAGSSTAKANSAPSTMASSTFASAPPAPPLSTAPSSSPSQGKDVQKFGIIAKANKFPAFQAQVIHLDAKRVQTNQAWPFEKGQSGVLNLQYLSQSFTLQGSVEKTGDGKVLVLETALDYVYFQDFLHILGVS